MSGGGGKIVVLLKGSKTFWKTRTFLKIHVIYHDSYNCIEVIGMDPALGIEYDRLYLDCGIIDGKLSADSAEEILNDRQIQSSEGSDKTSSSNITIMHEIKLTLMLKYVFVRLIYVVDAQTGKGELTLQPLLGDVVVKSPDNIKKLDFEREKPQFLQPYYDCELVKKPNIPLTPTAQNSEAQLDRKIGSSSSSTQYPFVESEGSEQAVPHQKWFKLTHKIITKSGVFQGIKSQLSRSFFVNSLSRLAYTCRKLSGYTNSPRVIGQQKPRKLSTISTFSQTTAATDVPTIRMTSSDSNSNTTSPTNKRTKVQLKPLELSTSIDEYDANDVNNSSSNIGIGSSSGISTNNVINSHDNFVSPLQAVDDLTAELALKSMNNHINSHNHSNNNNSQNTSSQYNIHSQYYNNRLINHNNINRSSSGSNSHSNNNSNNSSPQNYFYRQKPKTIPLSPNAMHNKVAHNKKKTKVRVNIMHLMDGLSIGSGDSGSDSYCEKANNNSNNTNSNSNRNDNVHGITLSSDIQDSIKLCGDVDSNNNSNSNSVQNSPIVGNHKEISEVLEFSSDIIGHNFYTNSSSIIDNHSNSNSNSNSTNSIHLVATTSTTGTSKASHIARMKALKVNTDL